MRAGERAGELTQEQRCTTDAHLAGNHAGLEQLFRARVIAFLVEAGLLPLDRARMLRSWVHSGFQVHQSRHIAANECQDMERLAQYIVRNPFSIAKMQVNRSGDSILYRSGMNAKIKRNFQVFTDRQRDGLMLEDSFARHGQMELIQGPNVNVIIEPGVTVPSNFDGTRVKSPT